MYMLCVVAPDLSLPHFEKQTILTFCGEHQRRYDVHIANAVNFDATKTTGTVFQTLFVSMLQGYREASGVRENVFACKSV